MHIKKITENKKEYLDLLLLADEQENMIDKYLERGEMFVVEDDGVIAECVVTEEADGVYEIKNIAVKPEFQRKGYARRLIEYVCSHYHDCKVMLVGTGDTPSALDFYRKCGFTTSHRIKNFFTDNYDKPMFDGGKQLIDMVYLKRKEKFKRFERYFILQMGVESMEIKQYSKADEALLFDMFIEEGDEWGDYYRLEGRQKYIRALASSLTFVAYDDQILCGYVRCLEDDGFGVYVYDLLVRKSHRGKQIGKKLMEHVHRYVSDQPVYVMSDVDTYYEKLGYQKVGSIFQMK